MRMYIGSLWYQGDVGETVEKVKLGEEEPDLREFLLGVYGRRRPKCSYHAWNSRVRHRSEKWCPCSEDSNLTCDVDEGVKGGV